MAMRTDWLAAHVRRDHEWLLERLRSLDNCLEHILYFGEVCSDLRGFGGLRLRCEELYETLAHHIPEEEQMFARLGRVELAPLLKTLTEEHRELLRSLEGVLSTLEALESGALLPEDLFTLQDRVKKLSAGLQHHIATENELVLPQAQVA